MKVTILKLLGYRRVSADEDEYMYNYLLQAENGLVEEEEADVFLPDGYSLDLPDDEWQQESEVFTLKCDKCGYIREKKTVRGWTVTCPICNTEEVIPL